MSRPVRTLVAAIVVATLIVTGVAIVVPVIARPVIVSAVQAASPFGDTPLQVDVDCNVFGLLAGTVDRIRVRGTNLKRGDVTIGALDVTVRDAATSGQAFRSIDGTLSAVAVPSGDGTPLTIDEIDLSGPSAATTASATLDHDAAVRLIESAFADAGIDVSGIELGTGTVAFKAFGSRVEVPVRVENGAIAVVDPFGTGSLELVKPRPDDGWRFTGVTVTEGGMTIDAIVDAGKLLGG
jgi:hypothetical protein